MQIKIIGHPNDPKYVCINYLEYDEMDWNLDKLVNFCGFLT